MARTTTAVARATVARAVIEKDIVTGARPNAEMTIGATAITIEITGAGDRSFRELGAYGHTPLTKHGYLCARRPGLDAQI
jgi:hypothetical protein